jgi:hypothetical protein
MLEYRTQGFNGYAVKYSPFFDSRIAVATSQHYGLVGNGRLYILGLTPKGIVAEKWYTPPPRLHTHNTLSSRSAKVRHARLPLRSRLVRDPREPMPRSSR